MQEHVLNGAVAVDLTCSLDEEPSAVLCDPSAIADGGLDASVAAAALVFYNLGDHDDLRFRLFVDEPVDPRLERCATRRASGGLRVPSGRLVACDLDDLNYPPVVTSPPHSTEMRIGPGDYLVEAFELDFGGEDLRAADAAARAASSVGFHIERVVGPVAGFVVGAGLLGILVVILFAIGFDAWAEAGGVFGSRYGLAYLGFVATIAVLRALPGVRRVSAARKRTLSEFPDAVVRLEKIPVLPAGVVGCCFGPRA